MRSLTLILVVSLSDVAYGTQKMNLKRENFEHNLGDLKISNGYKVIGLFVLYIKVCVYAILFKSVTNFIVLQLFLLFLETTLDSVVFRDRSIFRDRCKISVVSKN